VELGVEEHGGTRQAGIARALTSASLATGLPAPDSRAGRLGGGCWPGITASGAAGGAASLDPEQSIVEGSRKAGRDGAGAAGVVVRKPFTAGELLGAVRTALDAPQGPVARRVR
jgi:hypothetical protein